MGGAINVQTTGLCFFCVLFLKNDRNHVFLFIFFINQKQSSKGLT